MLKRTALCSASGGFSRAQDWRLSQQDCAVCHSRVEPDGSIVDGATASGADSGSAIPAIAKFVTHDSADLLDFFSPGETAKQAAWRWWAAPRIPGDINDSVKSPDVNAPDFAGFGRGVLPRFNGSPFYPTKTPDRIGLKDRKYIDHTATQPLRADIVPISVDTDPGLALKTRKGTGLYKVPSLRGVWYRGLFGHDGSVTTLEQWFDPARLRDNYMAVRFQRVQGDQSCRPGTCIWARARSRGSGCADRFPEGIIANTAWRVC